MVVGAMGIVGFSGNVFSAPDTIKFSGTIQPYIEIDNPTNISLTNGGSGFIQTLSGSTSWTVDSNDRFAIESIDGYGVSSSLTGAGVTTAADFDILDTVMGYRHYF